MTHLAVFFPGGGYRVDHPLLWFARRALEEVGATEVLVDYGPATLADLQDPDHAFFSGVRRDMECALETHSPDRVTLIGKSLGSFALAGVARSGLVPDASAVWLTPIWEDDATLLAARTCGWRSLYAVGTADPSHIPERHADVSGTTIVIEGANHSLEISDDLMASLDAHRRIAEAVLDFVR